MKTLPFDIYFDSDIPIRFKHDPESRTELSRERNVDEMMEIIEEHCLEFLVMTVMYNNDAGFGFAPIDVKRRVNRDGKTILVTRDLGELECEFDEDVSDIKEKIEYYLISFDDEYSVIFIIPEEGEDVDTAVDYALMGRFLECAQLTTLHKLGKTINKHAEDVPDLSDYGIEMTDNLVSPW